MRPVPATDAMRITLPATVVTELDSVATVTDAELHAADVRDDLARRLAVSNAWIAFQRTVRGILHDHAFAIIEGVDCRSDGAVFALGTIVGAPQLQPDGAAGTFLFEVKDRPQPISTSTSADAFDLHTDSASQPSPEPYIALACVTPDPDGQGASLLLSAEDLWAAIEESDPSLLRVLSELLFEFDGALGASLSRVLWREDGAALVRYRGDMAIAGDRMRDSPVTRALTQLRGILDSAALTRISLVAGEILVLDNRRALHGRTGFRAGSPRTLRRLKIR